MKYEVTLFYSTSLSVVVEAGDEREAVGLAWLEAGESKYDGALLNNIKADDLCEPIVEEAE